MNGIHEIKHHGGSGGFRLVCVGQEIKNVFRLFKFERQLRLGVAFLPSTCAESAGVSARTQKELRIGENVCVSSRLAS